MWYNDVIQMQTSASALNTYARSNQKQGYLRMTTPSIPRTSGIYKITCTANGKIYVGASNDLERRWSEHKTTLRGNRHFNINMQKAWDEYGENVFIFEVLEYAMPFVLLDREQHWLDTLKPYQPEIGFNIGIKSDAAMSGRKHTIEAKEKVRAAKMGHLVSDEARAILSIARKGKSISKEHKANISAGSKTAIYWIFTNPDGAEFRVRGLRQFCRDNNLSHVAMGNVARGLHHTHRGWKCRKAED